MGLVRIGEGEERGAEWERRGEKGRGGEGRAKGKRRERRGEGEDRREGRGGEERREKKLVHNYSYIKIEHSL